MAPREGTRPTTGLQAEGIHATARGSDIYATRQRKSSGEGLRRVSDELVDEVFEEFLAPTGVRGRVTLCEDVGFEVLELGLTGLDLRPDTAVPGTVALLHGVGKPAALADCRRDLQAAGEGVH